MITPAPGVCAAAASRDELERLILRRLRDVAPAALSLGRVPSALPAPPAPAPAPGAPPAPQDAFLALTHAAFHGLATPGRCSKVRRCSKRAVQTWSCSDVLLLFSAEIYQSNNQFTFLFTVTE